MPTWNWTELRSSSVIFEDSAILVLNKPADIAVTGDQDGVDIIRLASEAGEQLFPVHRIDKVTTGVVLFAKDLQVHGKLTRQFNKRTVEKRYLLIVRADGLPPEGLIDLPLTVGRKGIVRVAARRGHIQWDAQTRRWWVPPANLLPDKKAYPSITRFATLWSDSGLSLVMAQPLTGRKQQLRIHFAWIGHPIVGDPLFDEAKLQAGWQTCLHSWRLEFEADWRKEPRMAVEAPPALEFWRRVEAQVLPKQRTEMLERARERRFTEPVGNRLKGRT